MTDPLPRRIAWFAPWTWKRRWWVFGLLLAVLSYPLSIGPAWGLLRRGMISTTGFQIAYAPLIWITKKSDRLYWWTIWYIFLFG